MDKTKFTELFNRAMKVTQATSYSVDDATGEVYTSTIEVKPTLTIRDFMTDSYPDCDTEFDSLEEAWEYYQQLGDFCRLILADGTIVYDYYSIVEVETL